MPCENSSGDDHLNRCLRNGLGNSLPGKNKQKNLVKSGTKLAHKNFGTSSSKTSSDQIYKGQERKFSAFPNNQHNSFSISIKNEGTKNGKMIELCKDIWKYLVCF